MRDQNTSGLSIGECATLACLMEAGAPKPGNVHPDADFEDMTFADLETSAAAIGPIFDNAERRGVGRTVVDAVRVTRQAVGTNTNLGMVLLMAPLASVPCDVRISEGVGSVLDALDRDDARQVYEAIRLAKPGGLGREAVADVADGPPSSLVEAMRWAADRDLVARQYANGFHEVLELVVPWLVEADARGQSPDAMIVEVQLRLMSEFPDSLIARKCGAAIARQAQDRAAEVLSVASSVDEAYQRAISDFDDWLRGDGHRRNPGTTADLIAAGLFVALREGTMGFPSWSKTTAATTIRVK